MSVPFAEDVTKIKLVDRQAAVVFNEDGTINMLYLPQKNKGETDHDVAPNSLRVITLVATLFSAKAGDILEALAERLDSELDKVEEKKQT